MDVSIVCVRENQINRVILVEKIYREHKAALLKHALLIVKDKSLAEDIVHVACEKLMQSHIQEDKSPVAYAFTTVKNIALNMVSRDKAVEYVDNETIYQVMDSRNSTVEMICIQEAHTELIDIIKKHAPKQCNELILRYIFEYTDFEIAEILKMPYANVRMRIKRGKGKLKKFFGENGYNHLH